MREMKQDALLMGKRRERKRQASGGLQTYDLFVTRRVLYLCATTIAQESTC